MVSPATASFDTDELSESELKSDQVLVQLRRIRGQLDGIMSMYEDERGCVNIVRQIIAARSGLGRVARDLLTGEAARCSREDNVSELEEVLKEVFRY